MGFSAVAGHVILLVALFSTGILIASAINNSASSQIDARDGFADRLRASANEDIDLNTSGYASGPDRTYANFTNNGSEEIELDDVTLLVDGTATDTASVATFEVRDHPSSDLWMPGEILEVVTDSRGDADITVAGPHGAKAYRRA